MLDECDSVKIVLQLREWNTHIKFHINPLSSIVDVTDGQARLFHALCKERIKPRCKSGPLRPVCINFFVKMSDVF